MISSKTKNNKIFIPSLIIGLWKSLTALRKQQVFCLLILMLLSGLGEAFSIASIIPLLSVIIDPITFSKQTTGIFISNILKITNPSQLIAPVAFIFIVVILFSSIIRLLNLWAGNKFVAKVGCDISMSAYEVAMNQPYEVHLLRNSSKIINTATFQTSNTVAFISTFLDIITGSFISISILIILFLIEWKICLILFLIMFICYFYISNYTKKKLLSNSKKIVISYEERIRLLQEGLGSIREVILNNAQEFYKSLYSRQDRSLREKEAQNWFLGSFPKFILEAIAIILLTLIALLLNSNSNVNTNVSTNSISALGTVAFGIQKLLPSVQFIYARLSNLRALSESVLDVLQLINKKNNKLTFSNKISTKFNFNNKIIFKDVSFSYKKSSKSALKNINLEIKSGEKIGILGETGSGKSTFVDLLMGLIKPSEGKFFVDNIEINDPANLNNLIGWQSCISHVPQSIFLLDNSFLENIAFGIPKDQIDFDRIKKACGQAQILDFINQSKYGFDTFIGEKGVRLSGGQRQRIGIARALYKKSSVLILDEATSALDKDTEFKIIESIHSLDDHVTIISIAHRLSSLEHTDRILKFKNSKIIQELSFNDIIQDL